MKQTAKRRTQEERKSEAENALLDAAAELISEQGIVQTSLAQIGERAGYSRGLVNHHFGSKDVLIERLIERSRHYFLSRMDFSDETTGLERLLKAADYLVSVYIKPKPQTPALLVMWGAAISNAASHVGLISDSDESARKIAEQAVIEGQQDGSISAEVSPKAFSVLYLAMIRGVAAQLQISRGELPTRKLRGELKRLLTEALTGK